MAQAGYTPIQLYYSSTTTNAPTAGNLASGELAINITDGKLFYKDNGGSVQVIAWKTTPTTAGGTGLTSWTAGDLPYYATGTTLSKLGIGTNGQILTSTGTAPQWSTLSGVAVTTFSAGTTGFTPSSATSGAITLAGTLATTNGGTGLTSFTANRVFYSSSTSAIGSSANLTFDGTTLTANALTTTSTVTINGGTANGVAYLNGSKVLTTGSALTFDGTELYTTGDIRLDNDQEVRLGGNATYYGSLKYDSSTGNTVLSGRIDGFPIQFNVLNTEQMRLTSTGLGIGTSSPGQRLDVNGSIRTNLYFLLSAPSVSLGAGTTNANWFEVNTGTAFNVRINGGDRMIVDSSGNLGLGVTPSAWGSAYKAMQIGSLSGMSLMGYGGAAEFGNNFYFDTAYRYAASTSASRYTQSGGAHAWYIAGSGTAGNLISFTQAMTLDASGNLGLGTTSPNIYGTSNSTNVFGVQGSGANDNGLIAISGRGTGAGGIDLGNATIRRAGVYALDGSVLGFYTNGSNSGFTLSERARITSAGTFQLTNNYQEGVLTANTGTAYTIDLVNGTLQILTLTGNCTFTFPTATAGQSFIMLLRQDATGGRTVTWPAAVRWPGNTAPTITSTASQTDKYIFTADGTRWYGSNAGQAYVA